MRDSTARRRTSHKPTCSRGVLAELVPQSLAALVNADEPYSAPRRFQFVSGWQPLGTEDSQGEDQNDQ